MATGDKKPVVMTEDIDQSVAKKLHAAQHASDGSDPITPAAIGALSTGGGTMTGKLKIVGTLVNGNIGANTDDSTFRIDGATRYDKGAFISLCGKDYWDSGVFQVSANNGTSQKNLKGYPNGTLAWDGNNILHAGNKPSGSYPATNSAAAQTILTGAVGNMVLICGNGKITVVTESGGVCSDGTILSASEVKFTGGTLTVSSAHAALNASGTYYYQAV